MCCEFEVITSRADSVARQPPGAAGRETFRTRALLLVVVLTAGGCSQRLGDVELKWESLRNRMSDGSSKATAPGTKANTYTNSLGMEFVRLSSGEFFMGNPDPSRFGPYSKGEGPLHQVELSRPTWMGRHEVTVGQFREFVKRSGYLTEAERGLAVPNGLNLETGEVIGDSRWTWKSPGFSQGERNPVVCVTWQDAQEFCEWLSLQEGHEYRLPTEAEWEYACRAGSLTLFSTGDAARSLEGAANVGDQALLQEFRQAEGVAQWNDQHPFTAPVGSFAPNPFGLHDMHGNVGEWCQDWYGANFYSLSNAKDPAGPNRPTLWRVVRGGSWYNTPMSCRSCGRHDGIPTACSTTNGFRVVVNLDGDWSPDYAAPWTPERTTVR